MNLMEKYRARLNEVLKEEIFYDSYLLIEKTLQEINRAWESGAIEWMKANRPNEWGTMLTLEGRVNELALGSDTEGLKRALSEYPGLILGMVREFKTLKEKKGQEMFNFVECPMPSETGERLKEGMG